MSLLSRLSEHGPRTEPERCERSAGKGFTDQVACARKNRAENSHLPIRRRERKMLGFKSRDSAQRFQTTHAAIYNAFDLPRHMISWPTLRIFWARADSVWARAVV